MDAKSDESSADVLDLEFVRSKLRAMYDWLRRSHETRTAAGFLNSGCDIVAVTGRTITLGFPHPMLAERALPGTKVNSAFEAAADHVFGRRYEIDAQHVPDVGDRLRLSQGPSIKIPFEHLQQMFQAQTNLATPGQTILLNGASSSGKSSIARELQALLLPDGYLHTGLDHVLERVPRAWWGPNADPDGFRVVREDDAEGPRTVVQIGEGGRRIMCGARLGMAALARAGVNLIIDEVLFEGSFLDDYVRAFAGLPVLFVGVRCPAEIASARELARGDRSLGAARVQSALVHTHAPYDLEVDTTLLSPHAAAETITGALHHPPQPPMFTRLLAGRD